MTPPGQPVSAGNDKTTLWGVLGIVFAVLCWPLGLVFAILGLNEAKRVGKQPTLAYIGLGLVAIFVVISIIRIIGALGSS